MEVSDASSDEGVCLRGVKTPSTEIHVSWAKWNVTTMWRQVSVVVLLATPLQSGWSSDKASLSFTSSKNWSYHSCRISLIFIHTSAMSLIFLSFSTSLESSEAYCICMRLVAAIVLHPHVTLLSLLPGLWLLRFDKLISYMNNAFLCDTDPETSFQGTSTAARTSEWDMTSAHMFSCLCD